MKYIALIFLALFSFSSCNNQQKHSGVNADKYLLILEKYNEQRYPNYTGKVLDKQNYDSVILNGETIYQNGKIVQRNTFFENGQLSSSIPIKYCAINGTAKYYFKNGKLKYSADYYFGVLDGQLISCDSNGKIRKIKTFKKGTEISSENFDTSK